MKSRKDMDTTVSTEDLKFQNLFVSQFELRGQKQLAPRSREKAKPGSAPLTPWFGLTRISMLNSLDSDGQVLNVDSSYLSNLIGHIVYCFWDSYGWCRGMVASLLDNNDDPTLNVRVLHDDGEEEDLGVPDPGVKIYSAIHENFVVE